VTSRDQQRRPTGTDPGPAPPLVPPWVPVTALALCIVGLAISAYLTYEHYSASATLACPETGKVNCLRVTTSTYSTLLGVPVALLGLLFFAAVTPLHLPQAWRARARWLSRLRLAASAAGVVFVVYLLWAELFRIDAICLWCTAVHVVAVALFAVVVLALAAVPDDHLGR
jgi:uncharacterized membrane protein